MENTKKYLEQALRHLPGKFNMNEVKYHIMQALRKIENVEKKASRKERQLASQSWNELLSNNVENPYTAKRTLDIIDGMIEGEKKKLKEPESDSETQTLFD